MAGKILFSWLGMADVNAALDSTNSNKRNCPVLDAITCFEFSKVFLISGLDVDVTDSYTKWLKRRSDVALQVSYAQLRSPVHFADIYRHALDALSGIEAVCAKNSLYIHLSPGTPAMAAVSILLGKTRFNAQFLQSSAESGTQIIDVPFDIAAEFLPSTRNADQALSDLSEARPPVSAAFDDIQTQNDDMSQIIRQAEKIAQREIPALILGESGTGKELFAKAMHHASSRNGKPFVPVNCGAIPSDLMDSELFGHIKGAFSGAIADRKGYFEQADGGTLFLDEFGELPADLQVRLLRVLQSGELQRVGDNKPRYVDVRVIAATNRDLASEVAQGRFREDLFYRVAIGVINLPPLRARTGDIGLLADHFIEKINQDASQQPSYQHKKFSVKAKNLVLNHHWPGNIRELYATLLRASIWSDDDVISEEDVRRSLLELRGSDTSDMLPDVSKGVDIIELLDDIKRKYLIEALALSNQNKRKAAELLGLSNYQTLTNWQEKLGL